MTRWNCKQKLKIFTVCQGRFERPPIGASCQGPRRPRNWNSVQFDFGTHVGASQNLSQILNETI